MVPTEGYTISQGGKKNTNFDPQELLIAGSNVMHDAYIRLHIPEMGSNCKSPTRTGEEAHEVEDGEVFDPLRKSKSHDYDNFLWSSSGNASSPSFCSEDHRFSGYLDLPIDAWFVSSPSTLSTITFFDGSRVNPIKEASLVLDQITFLDDEAILQENVKEEELVSWPVTIDTSATCSEDAESSRGQFTVEGFTHSPKFSLFHPDLGFPLAWNKDSMWGFDKKSEFTCFQSDIHTPVYKTSGVSSITDSSDEHSTSSSSSSSDYASEVMDLEGFTTDKPLFWPFDSASDWGSDAKWDFFVMSPRKDIRKVGNSPKTSADAPRSRLINGKMDSEKGCKGRLVFGSGSNSSASLDFKTTNGTRGVRRMRSMPSSLRKCAKTNHEGGIGELAEDKVLTKNTAGKHKVFLEDLLLVEKLNVEPAIESVLGLDEFDGHEGVESGFNKDDFFLDVIL